MEKNEAEKIRIDKAAILELLRTARIMKRQLKILKGMSLSREEKKLLSDAVKSVMDEYNIFRI